MASLASDSNILFILPLTALISAPGDSTTKVLRKELNQLLLLLSSAAETFNGSNTWNLIDEFCGQFLATPVITKGLKALSCLMEIILPTASVLPKYLIAMSSLITAELGWVNIEPAWPLTKGKLNTEKKLAS